MSFDNWTADLERRHLADLQFSEVSRALRALSSTYVERRGRLGAGAALSGAGKRAAFALFYGPLHFLTVREVVREVGAERLSLDRLIDLGCGTGVAGAAWAGSLARPPQVTAVDVNPWALGEAVKTYECFEIRVRPVRGDFADLLRGPQPSARGARTARGAAAPVSGHGRGDAILAGWAINELDDPRRAATLDVFVAAVRAGCALLIVEPLARAVTPWWNTWRSALAAAGARADEWRFRAALPPIVAKLDRAAGLDHRELTARTIYAAGASAPRS